MSHATILRCCCDECGRYAEFTGDARGHEDAAEAGWYVNTIRPRTLCPTCLEVE